MMIFSLTPLRFEFDHSIGTQIKVCFTRANDRDDRPFFETSLGELDDRGVSQRRFLLTSLARHGRR